MACDRWCAGSGIHFIGCDNDTMAMFVKYLLDIKTKPKAKKEVDMSKNATVVKSELNWLHLNKLKLVKSVKSELNLSF